MLYVREFIYRRVDVNEVNETQRLHYAINENRDVNVIRDLVLQQGVDINAVSQYGDTPLHCAIYCGREIELIRVLLELGAKINAEDAAHDTPLHSAINRNSELDIIKLLLQEGADTTATDMLGDTPLHFAIGRSKDVELIRVLAQVQAGINVPNGLGDTPLHCIIKYRKNIEYVRVLLQQRASTSAENDRGETALRYAVKRIISYGDKNEPHVKESIEYNLKCARLLIEYAVLNNDNKYRNLKHDVLRFKKVHPVSSQLSRHINSCTCEVKKMKMDMVSDDLTLYDIVTRNTRITKALGISNMIMNRVELSEYPIYCDVISEKMQWHFRRPNLFNKLNEKLIYSVSDVNKGKKIVLNFDSVCNIAKYLSNNDLSNFVEAFDNYIWEVAHSSGHIVKLKRESDTELDEATTNSYVKRKRLGDKLF